MSCSGGKRADLGRALCVITGASRGFGRALARGLSGLLRPPSALVLVARSAAELRAAQAELAASEAGRAGLVVRCVVADLAEPDGPRQVFADGMEHVLLVNNAASLGDVSRYARTFTTRAEVDSYMSLNISSCLCLTACVLQAFPQRPGVQRTVVNVSSLCAQQPFSSWVLYCTAKAARDMMFRVLAAEEPELRVLSYAPGLGPLDTDMFSAARATTADPGLRRTFSDMSAQGRVLSEQSCSKLMELLLEDTYQSGAHVDFYDI
uniref:Sepiapterin reductase n=1 Tax=Tetraodon nigroviridis TaxID=99883 RepID=H3DR15_TETNG